MNQDWNTDEIIEYFTLLPSEFKFPGCSGPHNQAYFRDIPRIGKTGKRLSLVENVITRFMLALAMARN